MTPHHLNPTPVLLFLPTRARVQQVVANGAGCAWESWTRGGGTSLE